MIFGMILIITKTSITVWFFW